MKKAVKGRQLQQKIMLPNVVYLLLLALAVFFVFNTKTLITDVTEEQERLDSVLEQMQQSTLQIKSYLNKDLSFDQLQTEYRAFLSAIGGLDLTTDFEALWRQVEEIDALRQKNARIEDRIHELTDYSIQQSNGFIQKTIQNLADEQARTAVSTLERLVIIGANVNTSASYEVKVLLGQLKDSLDAKTRVFAFLDELIQNVEQDVERLAGTPFAGMAKEAKKANLQIKKLFGEYIQNLEQVGSLQNTVFQQSKKGFQEMSTIGHVKRASLFSKVTGYFQFMLIAVFACSLLGIIWSFLTARSVVRLLRRLIAGLFQAADQIAVASDEVSSSSQSLAEGSSEQASSLEETSSSLEEMASQTRQNADNATQAEQGMQEASQVVHSGVEAMQRMNSAINEIKESSNETSKIIKTIDEIAFQTNLLALNAAVEAARAGEAGKGFAVVAEEVRNLAQRSAEAAQNTSQLIEKSQENAGHGVSVADEVAGQLESIKQSSEKVNTLVSEIAAASKEQSQGIDQINTAVAEMDKVVQQNAADSEESASASEELSAQAQELNSMVAALMAVVGGSHNGDTAGGKQAGGTKAPQHSRSQSSGKRQQRRAPRQKNSASQGSQQSSSQAPDTMIPLDEKEFDDF